MYFFPLLFVSKRNQNILDDCKKELEMNIKTTSVSNLTYFIKSELKLYEYITHIIIEMDYVDEKDEDFITAIEALRIATDVPIIIWAENHFPSDKVLSIIANKRLANVVGETAKKLKKESKRKMKSDLREALIKSTTKNPIGLRSERQCRWDTTYNPTPEQLKEQTQLPKYDNPNLHFSIGLMGTQHRVGVTTFACQLADYFTARGAKVAIMSRTEYTDCDLTILKETYECKESGRYFTYRDIDFYFFGREPENANIYNIIILDYGINAEMLSEFFKCGYRYMVSGLAESDIINTINCLSNDTLEGKDYRIMFNFADASMCGEHFRHLIEKVAPNIKTSFNVLYPNKFQLPASMHKLFDEEFMYYKQFVRTVGGTDV